MKSLGIQYLDYNKIFTNCPLCGNVEITRDQFQLYIEHEVSVEDKEIVKISNDLNNLIKQEDKLLNEMKRIKEIQNLKLSIDAADNYCINIASKNIKIDKLESIKNCINHFEELVEQSRKIHMSNIELEKNIKEFIIDFNYEESLEQYSILIKNICKTLKIEVFDSVFDENLLYKINKRLVENQMNHDEKLIQIKRNVDNNIVLINEKKSKEFEYNEEIKNLEIQSKQLIEKLHNAKRMKDFFNLVKKYFNESKEEFIPSEILNQANFIQDTITKIKQSNVVKLKIDNITKEINMLDKHINLTTDVLEYMNKLIFLSKYSEEFIKENISRISNLFTSLHTPREFIKLDLLDGDKLVGIRDDSYVPIHLMSTGQKTAVVLSVFFHMSTLLEDAPNFMLIDEPVANIDDLNILGLFDFLRELVLNYDKQIFFTTASYNVRKLFKRKFSFLSEDFTELQFERTGNSKTCIKQKNYNQENILEEKEICFR